jgi:hypothetical protein
MSGLALLFDSVPLPRAETGACARRRSNFLLRRQKKVTKEKATLHAASLRFAAGNLRCSRPAGSRSNSLRFTALRQSRALIRWPLRSSAHPEGNPPGSDIHTGHCFAALRSAPNSQAQAPRAAQARPSEAKARVAVRLLDVRLSNPCWLRLRRGGCGVGMRASARMHRCLARRSCLNEAAPQRSEFCGAPRNRPDAGRPFAPRRGRRLGVAFSLVTFFWRSKRKLLARRGDNPASALNPSMFSQPASQGFDKLSPNGLGCAQHSTTPARLVGTKNTTKIIAASA